METIEWSNVDVTTPSDGGSIMILLFSRVEYVNFKSQLPDNFNEILSNPNVEVFLQVPMLKYREYEKALSEEFKEIQLTKQKRKIYISVAKFASIPFNKLIVFGEDAAKEYKFFSKHINIITFSLEQLKTLTMAQLCSYQFYNHNQEGRSSIFLKIPKSILIAGFSD